MPAVYDDANEFHDGLARVGNYLTGIEVYFIDTQGNVQLEAPVPSNQYFSNGAVYSYAEGGIYRLVEQAL